MRGASRVSFSAGSSRQTNFCQGGGSKKQGLPPTATGQMSYETLGKRGHSLSSSRVGSSAGLLSNKTRYNLYIPDQNNFIPSLYVHGRRGGGINRVALEAQAKRCGPHGHRYELIRRR